MSKHRRVRISRVEAERLLDTGVCGGRESLAALLAAATPPPASGELAGERAALAEFRAAHLATIPSSRRPAMLKTVLANLAAAKVALAATAAAAATGGVVLVAATGHLPGTAHGPNHADHPAPIQVSESVAPSGSAPASESEPASQPSRTEGAHPSATPSPSLRGLCHAFQAGATDNPGKAIDNPAFSVLVSTAGGKDNVAAFCVTLIGPASTHPAGVPSTHPGHPQPTHPGQSTHPTGRPTNPGHAPSTHPTGPPSTHPTGPPSTHPAGAPTSPGRS